MIKQRCCFKTLLLNFTFKYVYKSKHIFGVKLYKYMYFYKSILDLFKCFEYGFSKPDGWELKHL